MDRIINVSRFVLAAVLFLAALELCARVDDYVSYRAPVLGVYTEANLFENDDLGKHGKPLASYRKWRLNEFGYRGPHVDHDRIHIATFGASETFGLYESEDHEYPRQLERELNWRTGSPLYQVVNVAYPGQTLPTATARVPEIVSRFHPPIALIYPTPNFYIDVQPRHTRSYITSDSTPAFEWRLTERGQNVVKSVLPTRVQTAIRAWQIRRWTRSHATLDRLPEEAVVRYREELTDMLNALRTCGVEPVVVTHATRFGTSASTSDRAMLVAWRKFHPKLEENGLLDLERRMNQAMREVAAQEHATVVDLEREIPPGGMYFADYQHFSDAGAALVAKRLADAVEPLLHHSVSALPVSSAGTIRSNYRGVGTR